MKKISIQQIYTMYGFDITKVADRANVTPYRLRCMITGQGTVSKPEVEQVLAVLRQQLGRNYTLRTVRVGCKVTDR